jgi:succinate-semialdehyde dehydrogenase/glutarate-semialdehyde dehydrogenase
MRTDETLREASGFDGLKARAEQAAAACPKQLLIGGEWTEGDAPATRVAVEDPATGAPFAEVCSATSTDALAAMESAAEAFPRWSQTPPHDRAEVLRTAYERVIARKHDLAALLTMEMGKPFDESLGEVIYAADYLAWFAEEAVRIDGRYAVAPDGSGRVLVMRQPVGVCLFIVPWNFPLVMATRGMAPAIAAGCSMITKPSRLAPLSSLALAEILVDAGVPPGVVNMLPSASSAAVTEPLITDSRLRKLTFTGSTAIGRKLIQQSSEQVLRLSLELGGNAPFIVFDDADLDVAIEGALRAKIRNNGEACTSANRFLVQRGVYADFAERLADSMSEICMGHGLDPETQLGPLIEEKQRHRVQGLVDDALGRGAKLLTGGSRVDRPGYFYAPTVLMDVPWSSRVVAEEIFGPVAPLVPFDDEAEAIGLANDTEYGLSAYLFTKDFDRAIRVVEGLETGMVGLNQGKVSNPMAPFGGVKQSGLGRAGGPEAIAEYLETKYVAIRHQ